MAPATRRRRLPLLLAVCLLLAACGDEGGGAAPSSRPYEVEGRLLDAETGAEVSARTIYLHFFCDEVKWKLSLDPEDTPYYAVKVPRARVRVRAHDQERTYAAFERELVLEEGKQTFDIRLQPTHYVRLHGRVVDGATGKPIPPATPGERETLGDRVLFYFQHEGVPCHPGTVAPADDGSYALKVPRGVIKILAVNTAQRLKVSEVDLTGIEGDEHVFDIVLE